MNVPIAKNFDFAVLNRQSMARQERMHVLEKRIFADRVLEGHILGERIRICRDFRQDRQQRLHL